MDQVNQRCQPRKFAFWGGEKCEHLLRQVRRQGGEGARRRGACGLFTHSTVNAQRLVDVRRDPIIVPCLCAGS